MAKKTSADKVEPKAPVKAPLRKAEAVPGPTAPVLYVNSVQVDISTWDVRMRVGQIQGLSNEGVLQVHEVAHMFMSHQHFRAFVNAVSQSLKKVESIDSSPQIPLPPRDGETS